ncbi:hypothetical protein D1007_26385 [Hordeum vulgare]|nr:hypothetical protein D1007_26385 [Hordeum vulgare]
MTVTLQDISMITALLVEEKPLCMSTDSEGWRQQIEALIGMSPREPEVEDGDDTGKNAHWMLMMSRWIYFSPLVDYPKWKVEM